MRWSERQRTMLAAMGITLWAPRSVPDAGASADDATAREPARVARPASRPHAEAMTSPDRPRTQALPEALTDRDARTREIALLDWHDLRDRVASCRACRLCEGRRHTVFGVGHPQAHWMIVGEAPGEQEDRLGEPFVGPAGELLDRMLQSLGLTRGEAGPEQQVFIANTLKGRPPRNRNPEPDELALCGAFLHRQIELVNPRLILAMGRFAVQALLGSIEPIGRLRGRVHQYRGRPVVVTYHPAYLLRSPAEKARSWADLCLAASQLSPSPSS
jgi:DNA polymerase